MPAQHGDRMSSATTALFYASTRMGKFGFLPQMVLRFVFGVDLSREMSCGTGLELPHGARGLVVHGQATIGNNVTLHHNVTLGARRGGGPAPTLGDDVNVGAGAAILGGVRVGHGAVVGANAVVLVDVPDGAVAVGNPARIIVRSRTGQ